MNISEYKFRFAERRDTELVLNFIKRIAAYEEMPDAVKYTKESLEEWLFAICLGVGCTYTYEALFNLK